VPLQETTGRKRKWGGLKPAPTLKSGEERGHDPSGLRVNESCPCKRGGGIQNGMRRRHSVGERQMLRGAIGGMEGADRAKIVGDIHFVSPESFRERPVNFDVVPFVDEDAAIGVVKFADGKIFAGGVMVDGGEDVVEVDGDAAENLFLREGEYFEGLNSGGVKIHIEGDEADGRFLQAVDEAFESVGDVADDKLSGGEEFAAEEWLVHGVIAGGPEVRMVAVVRAELWKARTDVKADDVDAHAEVRTDQSGIVLEFEEAGAGSDAEFEGAEGINFGGSGFARGVNESHCVLRARHGVPIGFGLDVEGEMFDAQTRGEAQGRFHSDSLEESGETWQGPSLAGAVLYARQ
jgi:hypothetical protein